MSLFDGTKDALHNGKTFTFNKNTNLQSMINTINNDEEANVTIVQPPDDGFTITADSGGKNSKVSIQNITGNAGANGSSRLIQAPLQTGETHC